MAQFLTLQITIARDDLIYLQKSNYNLCLVRDLEFEGVQKPGNVVFSGLHSQELGPRIGLQWKEQYQAFGTMSSKAGEKVQIDTNTRDIQEGQVVTFRSDGTTGLSGFPKQGAPFVANNKWRHPARIGANNFDAVSNTYTCFYVSPEVPMETTSRLLPTQSYSVFWDTKLDVNFMLDPNDISDRFSFDLTQDDPEITLAYKDGKWALTK